MYTVDAELFQLTPVHPVEWKVSLLKDGKPAGAVVLIAKGNKTQEGAIAYGQRLWNA